MYWTRYVLVDHALHGGGMHSNKCPSSLSVCSFVCLVVCLFVSRISQKCYEWIRSKLGVQVGCATKTNWLDFGEDLDPDLETRII